MLCYAINEGKEHTDWEKETHWMGRRNTLAGLLCDQNISYSSTSLILRQI